MIVLNKAPNVRVFPVSVNDKEGAKGSFFIFPGINGGIPESVCKTPAFEAQRQAGVMVMIETKKGIEEDKTRAAMKPDALSKVPDLDVVETMLSLPEAKVLEMIPDLVKEPTLKVLKAKETRASVIAALDVQIELIDKLNMVKPPK